jgi:hypothetical protein
LSTTAEQSAFERTGRFAEIEHLCSAFADRWPSAVRRIEFGRTPEGRPLLALLVTHAGEREARELRDRGIPILMIQACIHPGEPDGKDAGFMVLRELLQGSAPAALDRMAILFVPVFNADGHERFGRWNRINQNGPQEMGWRATAQNLNLNRDYSKADAPEMQAMLRLINDWDPVLCADLHVSDGADFEHDVSVQVEPVHYGASELHAAGLKIRGHVMAALREKGSLPLHFYYSLAKENDPAGGFADWVYGPRFSTGYWPLRNRFTVLVETHSWKPYGRRVQVTAEIIRSLIELAAQQGPQWLELTQAADRAAAALAGAVVALDYRLADEATWIDIRGYAYRRSLSEVSGATMIAYDPSTPQLWHVPLRDRVVPSLEVQAPDAGYLIPPAHACEIGGRLDLHGVRTEIVEAPGTLRGHESFRAAAFAFDPQSFEGRLRLSVSGRWSSEASQYAAGSLFVPISQPKARLVMALLEPQAPDSFLAWGFFNACFERKEYMEAYVAEQSARRMLAEDPGIAAEFHRRLSQDPSFAADPAARLDFFYQRHPSWDGRFALYPVARAAPHPAPAARPARRETP